MYIIYSIIVMFIMLSIVDVIYVCIKKYYNYINKKKNTDRNFEFPISYPITFLIGCIIRILIFAKDVTFLILLKETFLVGILLLLIVFNIDIFKKRISSSKDEISIFKNIEKKDGEKLFKKKNKDSINTEENKQSQNDNEINKE